MQVASTRFNYGDTIFSDVVVTEEADDSYAYSMGIILYITGLIVLVNGLPVLMMGIIPFGIVLGTYVLFSLIAQVMDTPQKIIDSIMNNFVRFVLFTLMTRLVLLSRKSEDYWLKLITF